jgi:hypothetical protein
MRLLHSESLLVFDEEEKHLQDFCSRILLLIGHIVKLLRGAGYKISVCNLTTAFTLDISPATPR